MKIPTFWDHRKTAILQYRETRIEREREVSRPKPAGKSLFTAKFKENSSRIFYSFKMANHLRLFYFYYLNMASISFWFRMCFWSTATLLYISGSQTIIQKPKLFDRNSFFVNILVLRRYKSAIIDIAHF